MSTIALIIAGGSGHRMGHDIPKQFINVYDKPVIIYTLESFQRHPLVDAIEVVCIDGWHDVLWAYAKQYGITKLKWVISGGATGQESIRNGVHNLESVCQPDDTLIIHDGIRPLVDEFVLSDVIAKCQLYGNAVTSMPYNEQIFVIDNASAPDHDPETTKQRNNETTAFADVQNAERDHETTKQYIPRETLRRVATPQAYRYDTINQAYHDAFNKQIGIHGSAYANTMMVELGHTLHLAAGSDRNIKLTTPGDLELFKGYLAREKGY